MSSSRARAYHRPVPTRFPLNPQLRVSATRLGAEGEPLLVIDDLLQRPAELVDAAAAATFAPAHGPAGGYPGLRAEAPLDYVAAAARMICGPVGQAWGLGPVVPARAECSFSLVTLPPDALVPAQRAPHIDTTHPLQFALLHYLCGPVHGGTAFFRHRATASAVLTEANRPAYEQARAGEGEGEGYVADGAPWFDCIGEVPAAFNRLVVYRSCLLHSGRIPDPAALSPDPRSGRLTANIFLTVRPKN